MPRLEAVRRPPVCRRREVDTDELREEATLVSELGFAAAFVNDVPLVHVPGVIVKD